MSRDRYRVRAPLLLPEDVDAATTGADGAALGSNLQYVLQDPRAIPYEQGVAGPPDLRPLARVQADEDAAFNRDRHAHRSRSMQRALENAELATGAFQIPGTDETWSPGTAALNLLDTATMGLGDEAVAGLWAATDPELDYSDAQRALQDRVATRSQEYPWSSRLGTVLGMAAGLPLGEGALAPAAGAATRAARVASTAGRTGLAGATLGGVGGYLRAPEEGALESIIEGAATGGLLGSVGGAAVGSGRLLRGAGVLRPTAGAALEGAGYGALATPGVSQSPITEATSVLGDAADHVAIGAGLGAGLGFGANVVSSVPHGIADIQETIGNRAARSAPMRQPAVPLDEAAIGVGVPPELVPDAPDLQDLPIGQSPREIADAVLRRRDETPWLRRLAEEAVDTDPAYARFRAAGLMERNQIRRLISTFGGPQRALQALRDVRLAEPGIYSQGSRQEIAERVRPAMQRDLQRIHQRVADDGRLIMGGDLAEDVRALIPAYERPTATDREAAIARYLRNRADDFQYGRGNRPSVESEALQSLDGGESIDAPIEYIPDELAIDYPELRRAMDVQGFQNERAWSGRQTTPLTPEQEADIEIYRVMQRRRDRELGETLGEEGYQDYLDRNASFRASSVLAPDSSNQLNVYAIRQPSQMIAQLAGMAAQGGGLTAMGSRVAGELQQSLIGRYRDSIIATLNEVGTHPQETLASMPWIVRALERAATPGHARRIAQMIERGAREGNLPVVVAWLQDRSDDDLASRLGGGAPADSSVTEDDTAAYDRMRARSGLAPISGGEPRAAPEDADLPQDEGAYDRMRARSGLAPLSPRSR